MDLLTDTESQHTTLGCHIDWIDYVNDRLTDDFWSVQDALLLLADLWPEEIEICEQEINHIRYGVIESPIVSHARLLQYECNVAQYDGYERLRINASKQFGVIRRKWIASRLEDSFYPPAFFINWAKKKGLTPSWLPQWNLVNSCNDIPPPITPIRPKATSHQTIPSTAKCTDDQTSIGQEPPPKKLNKSDQSANENSNRRASKAKNELIKILKEMLHTHEGTIADLYAKLRKNALENPHDYPVLAPKKAYEELVTRADAKPKSLKTIQNYVSQIRNGKL